MVEPHLIKELSGIIRRRGPRLARLPKGNLKHHNGSVLVDTCYVATGIKQQLIQHPHSRMPRSKARCSMTALSKLLARELCFATRSKTINASHSRHLSRRDINLAARQITRSGKIPARIKGCIKELSPNMKLCVQVGRVVQQAAHLNQG